MLSQVSISEGDRSMSVIRTDRWLEKNYKHPMKVIKQLEKTFSGVDAADIYAHLTQFGLSLEPKHIKQLTETNHWKIVEKDYNYLKEIWKGPNIPIFIFPSNAANRKLKQDYNSKAGLTFKDKIFLFLAEINTESEIKALFTHEYNHTCRLNRYPKQEQAYTLLDTIILEGLAENAVRERLGDEHTAIYTGSYNDEELKQMWEKIIMPNHHVLKSDRKHQQLLYGFHFYPKMAGYCVGDYLVRKYMNKHKVLTKDLFHLKTEDIAELGKVEE